MPDRTRPTTAISFIRELVDATSEAFAQDASMPDSGLLPRSGLPTPRNPVAAQVIGPNGRPTNIEPLFVTANNKVRISIPEPKRNLRPGRYLLRIWTLKGGVIYYSESSFLWGVLVVNTDKSIYTLGNIAKLSFGVLDNFGRTLCDAHITATITAPSGAVTTRSTEDGSIVSSPECGPNSITNLPDYAAEMSVVEAGVHQITVTATTVNGAREITDAFNAQDPPQFDVQRIGPTRIYPPSAYEMVIRIRANGGWSGDIVETIPSGFVVSDSEGMRQETNGEDLRLIWNVTLVPGETRELIYTFDAPNISPELYKLGPLTLGTWREYRQWQIASDATMPTVQSVTGNVNTSTVSSVPGGTNQLYIAIGHFYLNDPTVGNNVLSAISGGGLTWEYITGTRGCSDRITQLRTEWWWAYGSPSTFDATVTIAGTPLAAGIHIAIVRIDGAANEMPINGEYANSAGDNAVCDTTGTDTASPTIGLTISNADSLALNSVTPRNQADGVSTPDTDYTQDYEVTNISGSNASTIWAGHRTTSSVPGTETITHTLGSTRPWVVSAAEIRAAQSVLTQNQFQWYANNDSSTPATSLAAQNATATDIASSDVIRLRMNIGVTQAALAAGNTFKLQFATSVSAWTDVGDTSSVAIWRGYDNSTPADGATLPSTLLTSSTVALSYEEQNNSTGTPTSTPANGFGEWDWVVQNNGASSSATYYFRMVYSTNTTALDAYTRYPALTTAAASAAPTVTNVVLNGAAAITLTANTTTAVSVNATITDTDGCSDITGGTTTVMIYRSGIGSSTCMTTTNDMNCYRASAFTASSTCASNSTNTTTTFSVYYFANATDASSSYEAQNWKATVVFKDSGNSTGTGDGTGQELNTLVAINVTTSTIDYGTLSASSTTGATNQIATTTNAGNASTTLKLSAITTLVSGSNVIPTSSQRYATSTFSFPGLAVQLTDVATAVDGFFLTSPTSTTNVFGSTYWGLEVPPGMPTGTYSGTNLFTASWAP